MQEHLNAERDLYHAAFEAKDSRLAHEVNSRSVALLQKSVVLREHLHFICARNTGEVMLGE